MSNRKHAEKTPPSESNENYVLLREENKEGVAELLGYTIEIVDEILSKAAEQGYSGVKLPLLKR